MSGWFRLIVGICGGSVLSVAAADPASFVNPFIGTDGPGHSHPAASCPFGMVQAGPDTGTLSWDYCSGYQYRDKTVLGYSQNHLNGTGCPDFGDIQVLPFSGELGKLPVKRTIDKSTEKASPGWYEVRQPDDGVKVEIAAAKRAALYRFTWDKGRAPQVLVNLPFMLEESWTHSAILGSDVKMVGATVIKGSIDKTGWLKRKVSFVLEFNRPWKRLSELPRDSKAPRYVASFDESDGNVVMMRVAISHHDLAGAERNLAAEMPGWDIEGIRVAARRAWNDLFERSVCEGTDEEKTNWYTSLYHLYLQPNVYSDIGEEEHYTTLSLWDTARAAHPWYSLVTPNLNDKVIASLRTLYRRDGYLPSLAYGGGNGGGMVGFHSIPVLVDWALKNRGRQDCQDKDLEEIFAAVKATLTVKHPKRSKEDWDIYDRYGYYPYDLIRGESVSRTMECAYDDWCAAQLAKALGKDADAAFFLKRSSRWRNVIDTSIGLARGKDTKGRWRDPFDPYAFGHGADTANDFTECNAFQYTWHVLHDVEGLATAFGGADKLAEKMDAIFSLPETVRGPGIIVDVSGLIGQYVHGNEPCHHIPYFYPQLGHPEKAAERIRQICDKFYRPKPDGLCGNDDCGQMSAWYVFSAMGFYPFNPCGGEYIIGAPQLPKVTLRCTPTPNTYASFTMTAKNLSRENKYVKSVTLNGKPITDWKIRHEDIMKGGEMVFEMIDRKPDLAVAERGKRIMVLGDSITHFGHCEYYLQLFENLRHPGSGERYYNAGYSGGTIWTGISNLSHELERVKPDQVIVMFGMNDVRWTAYATNAVLSAERKLAADKEIEQYGGGCERLLRDLGAAGVTNVVLVTPTPYDEYSDTVKSPRRRFVNEYGLKGVSETVRRIASERGLPVVDLNRVMTDLCRRFPEKALCGPDRVHPQKVGYLLMAAEYLRIWKEEGPVAEVAVNALKSSVRAKNARVTNMAASGSGLSFDYHPEALPFPDCAEYREAVRINPEFARFNRETLTVTGLASGIWRLKVMGRELGSYSSEQLARGINLAELDTPCRREAVKALKAMDALHDFDVPNRDCACVRLRYRSYGVPMDDKEALRKKLDEHLTQLKEQGSVFYGWEKRTAEKFLDSIGKDQEVAEAQERLYRELASVHPVAYRIEICKKEESRRE